MKKIYAIYLVFVLIAISACKDNDNKLSHPIINNSVQVNQHNPYEEYGIKHNEMLDIFITYRDNLSSICDSSHFVEAFNQIAVNSTCEAFNDNSVEFHRQIEQELLFAQDNYTGVTYQDILNDINDSDLTTEAEYLMDLIDNTNDFQTLQNLIVQWETNVLNNNNIRDEYKEILLITGAVARYSTQYWYDVSNDQSHPWHHQFKCSAKNGSDRVLAPETSWGKVAARSVGVGLGYCAACYILGNPIVIGPVVGVAASADVAAAVYEFWDDIVGGVSSAVDFLFGWL